MNLKLKFPMILVDLEYTAFGRSLETAWEKPNQYKEIVQIAAIKLDKKGNEIESLDIIVKPIINPVLSKRFVKLTGITQDIINKQGIDFKTALSEFVKFTNGFDICTYDQDYSVFKINCELNNIDFPFLNLPFTRVFEELIKFGIDTGVYSSGTLYKAVGEKMDGHVHNALHDVRSMAVALRKLI